MSSPDAPPPARTDTPARPAHYLFFLALLGYGMFFTNRFRFDFVYATYVDIFNLYPMAIFRDPSLFVADAAANLLRLYAGKAALREFALLSTYRILLQAMPLGAALKVMGLALSFGAAALVYRTGRLLYEDADKAFFLAASFLVCFLSTDALYYGQSRTFGIFFFTLLVYALRSKRRLLVPPLFYLFYISYPYLALPVGFICVWSFFELPGEGSRRRTYLLLMLAALILVAATDIRMDMAMNHAAAFQPKFTGFAGETAVPDRPPQLLLRFLTNLGEHSRLYTLTVILFSAVLIPAFFKRGRAAFSILRAEGLAPLSMFPLAFLFLYPFNPLFASRQTAFAFPFLLTLLFADNVLFLLGGRRAPAAAAALAALFAAGHPFLNRIEDFRGYDGIYTHISGLPKDVMIAGAPDSILAAGVPFYAQRSLYYNYNMPGMMAVVAPDADQKGIRDRLLDVLCGEDLAAAGRFARDAGIDYFLVERAPPGPRRRGPPDPCGGRDSALYRHARAGNAVFEGTAYDEEVFLVPARISGRS